MDLRKKNRIKTIQSSLAIENNSLTVEQITAIIEGKRVFGNPREIKEVTNALEAYELLLQLNPYKEEDILKAHQLMMQELVGQSGQYRKSGVGVFNGKDVVHLAPPADRVPFLMEDLFCWLKNSDIHLLIKSSVFHYEFEFIHPFEDGNGRMGRLWQTVILKEWKEIFAWLPVETLIKENQAKYYDVLRISDKNGDSTKFIEFMLEMLLRAIEKHISNDTVKVTVNGTVKVTVNDTVKMIIALIKENPEISYEELAKRTGKSRVTVSRKIAELKKKGIIRRVGADKNGYWELVDE